MSALIKGRWLYINLMTLGLSTVFFWWWQQTTQKDMASETKWIPDYYLTNATLSQYNENGELFSNISALRFTHIQEFNSTDMVKPRFNIYLRDADTAWFGKADEGLILDSGAQINLTGNALVTNGPDLSSPLTLTTQSLRLFPKQNYAVSDDKVTLTGKYSHLTGTGMQLTLDTQRLLFLHQVKGTQSAPRN